MLLILVSDVKPSVAQLDMHSTESTIKSAQDEASNAILTPVNSDTDNFRRLKDRSVLGLFDGLKIARNLDCLLANEMVEMNDPAIVVA